ncbi:MAG: ribonuclease P protein component [Pseudomonadota bacterium]
MPDAQITSEPPSRVERLRVRRDFLFTAGGLAERKRSVVIQARIRSDASDVASVGFTATKKIGGAVVRNRAKRRLREAANALLPKYGLAGVNYVFIARQDTGVRMWSGLLDDVETALISLRRRLLDGETPKPNRRRSARGASHPQSRKA